MIYDTNIPLKKDMARNRFNYLIKKKARIEIIEKRAGRSLAQNRYLHLLLGKVALHTGYTMDFVKREFYKKIANKPIFIVDIEGVLGIVEDVKSTRSLTTEEMTISIERFRNWSAENLELYLPEPKDLVYLDEINNELEQYQSKLYL